MFEWQRVTGKHGDILNEFPIFTTTQQMGMGGQNWGTVLLNWIRKNWPVLILHHSFLRGFYLLAFSCGQNNQLWGYCTTNKWGYKWHHDSWASRFVVHEIARKWEIPWDVMGRHGLSSDELRCHG